jgi:hypothetical protein
VLQTKNRFELLPIVSRCSNRPGWLRGVSKLLMIVPNRFDLLPNRVELFASFPLLRIVPNYSEPSRVATNVQNRSKLAMASDLFMCAPRPSRTPCCRRRVTASRSELLRKIDLNRSVLLRIVPSCSESFCIAMCRSESFKAGHLSLSLLSLPWDTQQRPHGLAAKNRTAMDCS